MPQDKKDYKELLRTIMCQQIGQSRKKKGYISRNIQLYRTEWRGNRKPEWTNFPTKESPRPDGFMNKS